MAKKKKKLSKSKAEEMLHNPPHGKALTDKQRKYFAAVAYGEDGVIVDDMGQLNHPGKVTRIKSNNITMENIPYPVLGVSDMGDVKLMQPEQNYNFIGNEVTEFPMLNSGKKMPMYQMGGSTQQQLNDIMLRTALLKERQQKRDSARQALIEKYKGTQGKVNTGMLEYYKTEPKEYSNLNISLLPEERKKTLLETMKRHEHGGKIEDLDLAKSGIHIKPSKKGTFTKAAKKHGKGVQEFASQVLANKENYSPAMVKKANFARNASKWKHEDGGIIDTDSYAQWGEMVSDANNSSTGNFSLMEGINFAGNLFNAGNMIQQDRERKKEAEQFYRLSGVVKDAASLMPERVKRKYVRPEDMVINPNELYPTYGVGTNYLEYGGSVKNKKKGQQGLSVDPSFQVGSAGGMLGSWIGGGTGEPSGSSQLGTTVGGTIGSAFGPVGTVIGAGIGGFIGGVAGSHNQKMTERYTNRAYKNLRTAAFAQGSKALQNQYSSFMEYGGKTPEMQVGGELMTHWGGKAETASQNPYLPYGGETIMFKGNTHEEGGIGMSFGNSPVEVEDGEPAVKLDENGKSSLHVFGDMKIPSYGVSELGDPKAKNKKFKNYVNELNKDENKQNKVVEKGINLINDTPAFDSFDKLKISSGKAMVEGGNMKLKQIAAKKQIAASIQNAILETADEFGLKSDDLAKGKFKKAKNGKKIPSYQMGGEVPASVKRSEVDALVAQGWTLEEAMNRLSRTVNTPGSSVTLPQATGGPLAKEEEYWKNFLIPQLQKGASPEELVRKGYMSKSNAQRAMEYYRPVNSGRMTQYIPIEDEFLQKESLGSVPSGGVGTPGSIPPPSPARGANNKFDWMSLLNATLPYIRPSNQLPLDPNQLSGEMFALATNQVEPVQAQLYEPLLENVSDISLQDQLNANQADFNALTKLTAQNPAAQANLAAQKYAANSTVLGEQFRLNQTQKMGIYNRNRGVLNDATLKNLGILDQQYVRQSQANSSTKAVAKAALDSIADKIARNKLENKTLGVYENLYNYRFDNKGRAINFNPLAQFVVDSGVIQVDENGKIVMNEEKIKRDRMGNVINTTETNRVTDLKEKRNGGIVKSIKNL